MAELRKELSRMTAVIDELIKPQVEKYKRAKKEESSMAEVMAKKSQIESKVSFLFNFFSFSVNTYTQSIKLY